jgi:ubiquinone/menaquinone biosynthesis C-methylase UbiE
MNEDLRRETENLTRSWLQRDPAWLRDYLVRGVEDPRLNAQSIITRHFVIESLFGRRFAGLTDHEHRFGAVVNWLISFLAQCDAGEDLTALDHALRRGADNAEGLPIPAFISATYSCLPVMVGDVEIPNYLARAVEQRPPSVDSWHPSEDLLNTFMTLWHRVLQSVPRHQMRLVEPACGSANDYRFIVACGLAPFLDYTGFDLCHQNVANAREMFPSANFEIGNAFEMRWPDQSFDACFVHDLFEHLSIDGLHQAMAEINRVTRHALCAGFFSMYNGADHIIRPVDDYHCNTLSLETTRRMFEALHFEVQAIHVQTFLEWRLGCDRHHNPNAYTLIARRPETQSASAE